MFVLRSVAPAGQLVNTEYSSTKYIQLWYSGTHILQKPEDKGDRLGHNLLDPCPPPPPSPSEARHDDGKMCPKR